MTTTVTKLTARLIESGPQGGAGVVAVLLLIVLLIESQFLDMLGGARKADRKRMFQAMIAPLLFAFAVVMFTRLADIYSS